MSLLTVIQFGEKSLEQPSKEIDKKEIKSKSLRKLAENMLETMYNFDGVGLAAPQVGINKQLIVIDTTWFDKNKKPNPLVLINPVIVYKEGELVSEEGCLSFQGTGKGVQLKSVKRFNKVKVNYINLKNEKCSIIAQGDLLCRCLQHEIDHLNGILFVSRTENITELNEQMTKNGFQIPLYQSSFQS